MVTPLDTPIGQLVGADCGGAPGMDTGVSSNTRKYDYGPSCFDVRHNFRMSLLYHFPNLKSNGVLSKLVDGWWTGNIVVAADRAAVYADSGQQPVEFRQPQHDARPTSTSTLRLLHKGRY